MNNVYRGQKSNTQYIYIYIYGDYLILLVHYQCYVYTIWHRLVTLGTICVWHWIYKKLWIYCLGVRVPLACCPKMYGNSIRSLSSVRLDGGYCWKFINVYYIWKIWHFKKKNFWAFKKKKTIFFTEY